MISVDSRRSAKELLLVRMLVKYCMKYEVLIYLMKLTPLIEHKHFCCLKVVLAVPGYSILVRGIDLPGLFQPSRNLVLRLWNLGTTEYRGQDLEVQSMCTCAR